MDSPARVATPETRNGLFAQFDRLHLPDFGKIAKFASVVSVASAFAVAGIGKAQARDQMPNKAKVGAEISAVDNSFENSNSIFSPLTQITRQVSELSGPQVQFFDIVSSDNSRSIVNLKNREFIGGLQFYAKDRGDLRVRTAESNGQYDTPLIRLGLSRSEIYALGRTIAGQTELIRAVSDAIVKAKYNTSERVNIGLIDVDMGDTCFILPIAAPNPANVQIIDITHDGSPCPTSNKNSVGFSAMNVIAAQGILWIPRTASFVKDPLDTMSDNSINGNAPNFAWGRTRS